MALISCTAPTARAGRKQPGHKGCSNLETLEERGTASWIYYLLADSAPAGAGEPRANTALPRPLLPRPFSPLSLLLSRFGVFLVPIESSVSGFAKLFLRARSRTCMNIPQRRSPWADASQALDAGWAQRDVLQHGVSAHSSLSHPSVLQHVWCRSAAHAGRHVAAAHGIGTWHRHTAMAHGNGTAASWSHVCWTGADGYHKEPGFSLLPFCSSPSPVMGQ